MLDDPTASHRALHVLEPHRASPAPVLRVLLAVCAATQLVLAAPWLFGASLIPDERVAVAHLTRDGALGIIIATTGLLVASRPRYALVATLIGSIIFAAQLTTGVVDNHDQQASMVFELWHILVFAILALAALTITIQRRSTPHHGRNQQAVRVF